MSVAELVRVHGPFQFGNRGEDVRSIQIALTKAGFSTRGNDGVFGTNTRDAVRLYEMALHVDKIDGVLDAVIATHLDQDARLGPAPKPSGEPLIHKDTGFPHDDLASLIAFYGDPRGGANVNPSWLAANIVQVKVPFLLHFDRTPVKSIPFHRKAADNLAQAFEDIWKAYGKDQAAIQQARLDKYSGTGNYRTVRGSATKLSVHAFWAAIDIDAEDLPIGHPNPAKNGMPDDAVQAFKKSGAYWGNDYSGRKDPMHFQYAHE